MADSRVTSPAKCTLAKIKASKILLRAFAISINNSLSQFLFRPVKIWREYIFFYGNSTFDYPLRAC